MQAIVDYLAQMPSLHKAIWLFCCLSLATGIEAIRPLVQSANKRANWQVNLPLLLSTGVLNSVFSAILILALDFFASKGFGLFIWLELGFWLQLILAIAVLDLASQYTAHYAMHNIPLLWRFHQVHHSDTTVNATTGTRHHPFDYLIRELFSLVVMCALGIPLGFYVLYRLLSVFFTYFSHANIQLPLVLDRALSYVVVTPNAHKFHHHRSMPWTNRNYGNIFSCWDRIFGTFIYKDTNDVIYGVDTLDAQRANDLGYQLSAPFKSKTKPSGRSTN